MCLENSLITNNILKETDSHRDRNGEPAPQAALEMGLTADRTEFLASWQSGSSSRFQFDKEFYSAVARATGPEGLISVPLQTTGAKDGFHSLGKRKGSGNTGSPWLRDGPIQQSAGHRLRPSF